MNVALLFSLICLLLLSSNFWSFMVNRPLFVVGVGGKIWTTLGRNRQCYHGLHICKQIPCGGECPPPLNETLTIFITSPLLGFLINHSFYKQLWCAQLVHNILEFYQGGKGAVTFPWRFPVSPLDHYLNLKNNDA